MSRRVRGVAAAACVVLLLSGCGTRASDAEIEAGAGGGPVPLPQSALDALRSSAPLAPGAPAAPGADLVPPGTVAIPGAPTGADPADPAKPAATTTGPGPTKARAPAPAPAAGAAACAASGTPVNLGQVGTYSGVTGAISAPGRTALAVWVRDVNARGGLACHPVTVYNRDDGGDPSRSAALVQQLITERKIVALVANTVAFSISGFRSAVEAAKIPAVGGELIAPDWHESPFLFPQGASIADQIIGFIKQGVEAGKNKLAYLYCVEVGACTYADKVLKGGGAKKAGAEIVYSSAISITQTDFTAQCQNAKNAGVQELAVAMEGSAMARLARSCLALNFKPLLVGAAAAINPQQAADPKIRELGLATINPNAPWFATDQPGPREYQAAVARYAPNILSNGITSQMWASGRLLQAGVAKLGTAASERPLTAAMVLAGLGKVRGETLGGLTAPLDFTVTTGRTSGCVYLALLGKRGWTAPTGSKPPCNLPPKGTR